MIDHLSLTNFKAFRQAEIPFGQLTLLTGLNSSGKSTVMQALALLRQSATAWMLAPEGKLLLNGGLTELGVGRDVLHTDWLTDPEISGEYISIAISSDNEVRGWTGSYDASADVLPIISATHPKSPPEEGGQQGLLALDSGSFQYLHADRAVPATTYERSHETAIEQGFLGTRGEHAVNYLRHYQDDTSIPAALRHPKARSATLLSHTEAWLGELSPGVNLEAIGVDGTDLVRLSYGFGGTAGVTSDLATSNRQRPTNVGFGLTYTLPIVVACLTARPGSLLLLENPEAHLHPKGQTQIAFLMAQAAAAGAQLVVETHSDHVLNGIRLAVKNRALNADGVRMHYFRRRDTSGIDITSPVLGDDGMLSDWPEGFFDEWDNSVMELLS